MAKVHVIPHTHWDREWYFSVQDSLVLLSYNVDKILDTLENNTQFPSFLLDGQTSLIEDYLKIKPENWERIRMLVEKGRLLIGPWYTQTDEMVVGGESIVRNLLYGTEIAKEMGGTMPIGYLPDSFGQSSQMPQIFTGFDFDSVVLWRGICDLDIDKTEFFWESLNGSKVFVLQLRFGYGAGQNLTMDEVDIKGRTMKLANELLKLTDTGHVVLPNGGDQVPIQKNLDEIIKRINDIDKDNEYVISNYIDTIKALKDSKCEFETLKGEFTKPKNMRIHKSIYSTRYDLKKLNSDAESKLTIAVEPIFTLANLFGFEYPKGLIDRAWKLMLENQAHDSIGGCNSDSTNQDIKGRSKKTHEILDGILNVILKKMAKSIKTVQEGSKLIIINTLPYMRESIIECEIISQNEDFSIFKGDKKIEYTKAFKKEMNGGLYTFMTPEGEKSGALPNYYVSKVYIKAEQLPALGYDTYYIKEIADINYELAASEDDYIENKYYKVYLNEDSSISIFDKANNRRLDKCLIYQDSGNDGDEYNYSPPIKDMCVSSSNSNFKSKVYKSRQVEKIIINSMLKVPLNLENRKMGIADGELEISTEIILDEYSNYIRFNADVKNSIKDHRLIVLFNTGIKSKFSYADNQFGIIKRDINLLEQLEDHRKKGWKEQPINIEPMLSMIELNDGSHGAALLTNGIKEYQIAGEDDETIAITLFSTTGVLGKDDLLWRPGRASGINNAVVYTPDAQMLGESHFEFALYMHDGNINCSKAPKLAKELNSPVVTYQGQKFNMLKHRLDRFELPDDNILLPERYSFASIDDRLIISALKKAEDKDGYILRVFNPRMEPIDNANILFDVNISFIECNLSERIISDERNDKIFNLGLFNPCEVKTFRIKLI